MFASSILPEDIDKLELAAFSGRITVIDETGPELDRAVRYLAKQKIIGFDTESRPTFSPSQHSFGTALLQLSGPEEAFLFRIKMIGLDERLCAIMADENIVKVGAAVHDDIRGLQKCRKFEAKGFVDLQRIVWEYGIKDKSVKKMAAIILGVRISKTQQLSNWEADELSEPQQLYAATDAWVCTEMYNTLMKSEKNPLPPEELNPQAYGHKDKPAGEQQGQTQEKRKRLSPKKAQKRKEWWALMKKRRIADRKRKQARQKELKKLNNPDNND